MNKVVDKQEENLSNNNCPVCLEKFDEKVFKTKLGGCNHFVCELCFSNLIKYDNKCPVCKIDFLKGYIYKPKEDIKVDTKEDKENNENDINNKQGDTLVLKDAINTSDSKVKINENCYDDINCITYELSEIEIYNIHSNKIKEKGIGIFNK